MRKNGSYRLENMRKRKLVIGPDLHQKYYQNRIISWKYMRFSNCNIFVRSHCRVLTIHFEFIHKYDVFDTLISPNKYCLTLESKIVLISIVVWQKSTTIQQCSPKGSPPPSFQHLKWRGIVILKKKNRKSEIF